MVGPAASSEKVFSRADGVLQVAQNIAWSRREAKSHRNTYPNLAITLTLTHPNHPPAAESSAPPPPPAAAAMAKEVWLRVRITVMLRVIVAVGFGFSPATCDVLSDLKYAVSARKHLFA